MADSSFDPLALVKAMGPQRDPYSWAENYAQDAAKGEHLRAELKNRLIIQERAKAEQARENALNREQSESQFSRRQTQAEKLLDKQIEAGRFTRSGGSGSKDFDLPEGAMGEKAYDFGVATKRVDPTKYRGVVRNGKTYYVRKDGSGIAKITPPAKVGKAAPVEDDIDDVDDED